MKAILKLGYSCNNNCIFCHARSKKKFGNLNFEEVKKKIDIAKNKGVNCLLFSGGEPTIRKDIFKIMEYAKKQSLSTGLVTNGRMLSVPDFIDKLLNYNVKYCSITLHSSNEETYNKIVCTPSFKQTIKGIRNLIKNNIEVLVNVVLIKDNLKNLDKTVSLIKSLGVNKIKLSFVEMVTEKDTVYTPDMLEAAEKVKAILKSNTGNARIGWDGFPLCLMKGYEDKVLNLKTEGIYYISEVWEDDFLPSDEGNKNKINKCNYCKRNHECEGIYSKYLDFNPDIKRDIIPYTDRQLNNELIKDKTKKDEVRLVVLAARACCLNCKYCFVKMTNEVMDESTLKKSIDFLFSSKRKNLQLQFFGGEPLMLPDDVFRRSIDYAVVGARNREKDIKIIITTNSVYLNEEKIKFLENYRDNIIIEVSLDGDKESQNINRPQRGKKNFDSYSVITKNFPKLLKSKLDYRISMVISPETCGKLFRNFEHLLQWGFKKIWMMLSCGVLWKDEDISTFYKQLELIGKKYYGDIKSGKIVLLNLRDWFAPYRMNTELIIDLNEKIYPACLNYLIDSEEIKEEFCLGDLNNLGGKNIDYYDDMRISNGHSISLFFKENKIIPNYESNIKTGMMINKFVKNFTLKLKRGGIEVKELFKNL